MMRIVYLHQYFTTPSMSGGTRSYEMAKRLVRDGHTVDMITTTRESGANHRGWRVTKEAGITVHWLCVRYNQNMNPSQRIWAFLVFAFRASSKACSLKCDVIFASSTPLTIAMPAAVAKIFHRVPLVFEVRDIWPKAAISIGMLTNPVMVGLAKQLEKFAYRSSDRIVVLSPFFSEEIAGIGFSSEKHTLIPNACDVDLFSCSVDDAEQFRQSHRWLRDRPMLLFAGAMGRVNNLQYMVELAAETISIDPEIRFLLVGTGSEEDSIRALATSRGVLGVNFFMLPPVRKLDLPPILKAATICSAYSLERRELWLDTCNKVFDAWAAGRPTLANYGGFQTTIALEQGAGFKLPPVVSHSAAKILVDHIRDLDWIEQASKAATRLANEEFSRELLYQKLQSTLTEVVN